METLCPASHVPNSNRWIMHQGHGGPAWTKEENKKFESALAIVEEGTPYRWFKVAAMIPGKSVYDVINQYKELEADVSDIEAGLVPMPGYLTSSFTLEVEDRNNYAYGKKARIGDHERKKGVPWTEDEHRLFLLGLQKHGKGDWRSISRNFVISKTPTQVASHAQKYYLRQLSGGKDKRRPSIHDITTINTFPMEDNDDDNKKKPPLWDKCINDKCLMAFDSCCGDSSFPAHPYNAPAINNRCVVNMGGSTAGLHIQTMPRFHS